MTEFEDLTRKQQLIIDARIAAEKELGRKPTLAEVADRAYDDCSPSYTRTTLGKYSDVLETRQKTDELVADGEGHYLFELSADDTWEAIRLLPEELSQKVYEQVRER